MRAHARNNGRDTDGRLHVWNSGRETARVEQVNPAARASPRGPHRKGNIALSSLPPSLPPSLCLLLPFPRFLSLCHRLSSMLRMSWPFCTRLACFLFEDFYVVYCASYFNSVLLSRLNDLMEAL